LLFAVMQIPMESLQLEPNANSRIQSYNKFQHTCS